MTNIRQRKVDPSPSSRGTYPQEEMMRIVIEPDDDDHDNSNCNSNNKNNDHVQLDNDLDLHSYHYKPQPSRMIPDKRYKDYLKGRTSKRKEDVSMCPTGPECACHCIAFSWIAVAFLTWVGFMIDTQPIFIKGVQPKGIYAIEGVTYKVRTEDQHLPACATAYYTAFAYLVTVLLCFAYRRNCFQLLASKLHLRRRRRHDYCDIPDHADSRTMHHHHHHDAGLPLFQSSSSSSGGGGGMKKSGRRRRHHCTSALWNRCSIVMRNLWQRWCCGLRFSLLLGRHDTKRRSE